MADFASNLLAGILTNVFQKSSTPVPNTRAPEIADIAVAAIKANPTVAVVPVQSAWKSKINILNSAWFITVASYFGIHIPTSPQGWATAAVSLAVPVLTVLFKSFFTNTVTPASVKK